MQEELQPSKGHLTLLDRTVEMIFSPGGDPRASDALEKWVHERVRESGSKLVLVPGDPDCQPFLPALTPKGPGEPRIHYHFVPAAREEEPFQELLWQLAGEKSSADPLDRGGIVRQDPAEVLLFVSNHCPNCPHAVRTVNTLALESRAFSVHVLDVMQHSAAAELFHVRSVPTLLIDRQVPFVGAIDPDRFLRLIEQRHSTAALQHQIRALIQDGHVSEAGRLMAVGIDPSFLAPQFEKATFQDRLALLATFEEALEIDPRCLDPLAQALLPFLHVEVAPVRGDVADLLGKIGHPIALPSLRQLCEDPDPDVAEAALEAVRSITSRNP